MAKFNSRHILSIFAFLNVAGIAQQALGADGSSGCGVGWYLFKENSLLSSSSRSVTNLVLPSTFSMTSGTSNCAKHSIVFNEMKGLHFIESNSDSLEIDIASGQGQYIEGFAETFGCDKNAFSEFANTLQAGYSNIYTKSGTLNDPTKETIELYGRVRETLNKNAKVVSQCSVLSSAT